MNQGWLMSSSRTISAVPVLPATSIPWSAAAVPVPSRTTLVIISVSCAAVRSLMTRRSRSGSTRSATRPSGSTIDPVRVGFMSSPPLATADATIAICSGVTRSLSWPMPMRPTSTNRDVGGRSAPSRYSPLGSIWPSG